jgi:hypothetical protein
MMRWLRGVMMRKEGRKDDVASDAGQVASLSMHAYCATTSITYIVVIHCYLASILERKMDSDEDLHFSSGARMPWRG